MILKRGLLTFIYIVIFLFSLVVLIPKSNIYYGFEKEIKKHHFILDNETIQERFNSMSIENIELYFKGESKGFIQKCTSIMYIFYNSINIDTLKLNLNEDSYLINTILLKHTILSPLNIDISLTFDNNIYQGQIHLLDQTVTFNNAGFSYELKYLLQKLRFKYKNGVYVYEY